MFYLFICLSLSKESVFYFLKCFSDSSVGKESACKAGDPSWIPGLGRSAGEGIGYPLQYSWASLVAQLVKNLPVIREIWVQSLGWEDPLEKGKATHSSILAWRILWTVQSLELQTVRHNWATFTSLSRNKYFCFIQINFNWNIVDLQCCVSVVQWSESVIHIHIYTLS